MKKLIDFKKEHNLLNSDIAEACGLTKDMSKVSKLFQTGALIDENTGGIYRTIKYCGEEIKFNLAKIEEKN